MLLLPFLSRLRAVHRGRHDDDGVSLVEVIVAISVLAVVLTGTASALISSSAATRDSRDRSVGTNIAVEQLSALQALPFTSLAIGRTTDSVVVDGVTYDVTIDLDYVDVENGGGTSCNASSSPGSDLDYVSRTSPSPGHGPPAAPRGPLRSSLPMWATSTPTRDRSL